MEIQKVFGKHVRELREKSGLTQAQLAEKADLHHNYIGQIERGMQNISLEKIHKIANGLHVELNQLFQFEKSDALLPIIQLNVMLKNCKEEELEFLVDHIEKMLNWRKEKR